MLLQPQHRVRNPDQTVNEIEKAGEATSQSKGKFCDRGRGAQRKVWLSETPLKTILQSLTLISTLAHLTSIALVLPHISNICHSLKSFGLVNQGLPLRRHYVTQRLIITPIQMDNSRVFSHSLLKYRGKEVEVMFNTVV